MIFSKLHFWLIIIFFSAASNAVADWQPAQMQLPEGGTRAIEVESLAPEKLNVYDGGERASGSVQENATDDGASSLRVDIRGQPKNTWDISVSQVTTAAVNKGDALVASFWVRGKSKSGQGGGVTEFVFEKSSAPHTKSVQYLVETPVDGSWQHYWVAFKSLGDYDVGESWVNFQMGYLKQEIEVAKIELWNFGGRSLQGLPHTPLSYIGREQGAQWRKEAFDRIEKIRKADLEIKLVDGNGTPVANQPVRVKLDRHAFGFGTAANSWKIMGQDEDCQKYRAVLKENFNLGVVENGFKWPFWDEKPEYRQQSIDAMHWLKDNNLNVRGHVMVWPGQGHLPAWVKSLKDNPAALKGVLGSRIREMSYLTKGIAQDWDVINEGFDNHELMDWLGDEAMVQWFKEADAASPNCDLYYNDFAALVRGGHPTAHKKHFDKTIKFLIDNGAPFDGIGIQGHFGSLLTPPHRILQELDHLGGFKKKIMITEFDVIVPDEQLRADFLRDFYITCFSHEAVHGIVSWGFWSETHWMPLASFYNKDWSLTKLGKQWKQLKSQWQTDEQLTTDGNGVVKLRGFIGDYKVDVGEMTFDAVLPKAGADVEIKIVP